MSIINFTLKVLILSLIFWSTTLFFLTTSHQTSVKTTLENARLCEFDKFGVSTVTYTTGFFTPTISTTCTKDYSL